MLKSILLLFFLLLLQLGNAQEIEDQTKWNWRKHLKFANELYAKAQYESAAEQYEQAWLKKPKQLEMAHQAGENYFIVKNYKKTIETLTPVVKETKKFPKAGYTYAKALKQNEQYDEAVAAFKVFTNIYKGIDAPTLVANALMEIEGCELAKQYKSKPNLAVKITHLNNNINSEFTEFAPAPFGNDEMLFSSTKLSKAKVFKSQKGIRSWEEATVASQFASMEEHHVCNATFSTDEKRIYFTVCRSVENWGYLTTRCEIYATRRVGNLWSAPERLDDKINQEGFTATQPFVVQDGNKEILYFASNRPGGQGGMDIWYTSRVITDNGFDFEAPRNTGARINTAHNEITPFYDVSEEALYFSSDGHVGMGGLDIFKIKGKLSNWDKPVNLESPYNSGADDYFFIKNRYGDGGFLVSNRSAESSKTTTTDEDIFEFKISDQVQSFVVKGTVYDKDYSTSIENVEVSVYEILTETQERLIHRSSFENGSYLFQLLPGRQFKIIAHKEGFQPISKTFKSEDNLTRNETFYLQKNPAVPVYQPDPEIPVIKIPPMPQPSPELEVPSNTTKMEGRKTQEPKSTIKQDFESEYVYTPRTSSEAFEIRTDAPRLTGTYYKVQLVALANFKRTDKRYDNVRNLGRIDYEFIKDKGLTRVLVGDYSSKEEVDEMLAIVTNKGFKNAFIVKYQNGERLGMVK
jgi:cell division septation protein DedD